MAKKPTTPAEAVPGPEERTAGVDKAADGRIRAWIADPKQSGVEVHVLVPEEDAAHFIFDNVGGPLVKQATARNPFSK